MAPPNLTRRFWIEEEARSMPKLTVKDLPELKGVRQISFVQAARVEEAIAAIVRKPDCAARRRKKHHPGSFGTDPAPVL